MELLQFPSKNKEVENEVKERMLQMLEDIKKRTASGELVGFHILAITGEGSIHKWQDIPFDNLKVVGMLEKAKQVALNEGG